MQKTGRFYRNGANELLAALSGLRKEVSSLRTSIDQEFAETTPFASSERRDSESVSSFGSNYERGFEYVDPLELALEKVSNLEAVKADLEIQHSTARPSFVQKLFLKIHPFDFDQFKSDFNRDLASVRQKGYMGMAMVQRPVLERALEWADVKLSLLIDDSPDEVQVLCEKLEENLKNKEMCEKLINKIDHLIDNVAEGEMAMELRRIRIDYGKMSARLQRFNDWMEPSAVQAILAHLEERRDLRVDSGSTSRESSTHFNEVLKRWTTFKEPSDRAPVASMFDRERSSLRVSALVGSLRSGENPWAKVIQTHFSEEVRSLMSFGYAQSRAAELDDELARRFETLRRNSTRVGTLMSRAGLGNELMNSASRTGLAAATYDDLLRRKSHRGLVRLGIPSFVRR
jgi:hypothetical protein